MSEEREVLNVDSDVQGLPEKSAKEEESKEERKARFAQVLERGIINARLDVELPEGVHGEWVRRDDIEISRMEAMGFRIDTEYAKHRALHSDGTEDHAVVGDVIFMTCSRDDYNLIQEIKRERFMEMHGPKEEQKEERDYAAMVKAKTPDVPTIEESDSSLARKDEISAALDSTGKR